MKTNITKLIIECINEPEWNLSISVKTKDTESLEAFIEFINESEVYRVGEDEGGEKE